MVPVTSRLDPVLTQLSHDGPLAPGAPENQCWKLVLRPGNTNVVSCKWVYKTEEEQTVHGTLVNRKKSRVVDRGSLVQAGRGR